MRPWESGRVRSSTNEPVTKLQNCRKLLNGRVFQSGLTSNQPGIDRVLKQQPARWNDAGTATKDWMSTMSRTTKAVYRGSKAFDSSCRNHGSCPHCHSNRTFQTTKAQAAAFDALNEVKSLNAEDLLITLGIDHSIGSPDHTDPPVSPIQMHHQDS